MLIVYGSEHQRHPRNGQLHQGPHANESRRARHHAGGDSRGSPRYDPRRTQALHHELKEINRHLDTLDEEYKNLKGVTKEIDELRAQVRAIAEHLGLKKKIAA